MPRSIVDRTIEELGGPGSVLVRQRNDHQKLDQLLHELDGTTGREQEDVLRWIDRLVFSHAFAEESVLWPVLRRVLPDGDDLTLRVEEEHQEVNELESLPHEDPRRGERLARLVRVLREDVRDEEDILFPRLQESWIGQSCGGRAGSGTWSAGSPRPVRIRPSPAVPRATPSRPCRCRSSIAAAISSMPPRGVPRRVSRQRQGRSVAVWRGRLDSWNECRWPAAVIGHPPAADRRRGVAPSG